MKDFVAGAAARKLPNLDPDLNEIVGRPTGQGFGAARKGPQVHGTIEAVVDSEYPQGESFSTSTNDVKNIFVK